MVASLRPRVLLAKVGLDGHDRGVKVVARALRDAGMEVIYTGLWNTPAAVARAAVEEDVDVVGLSLLSAAHMTQVPLVLDALTQRSVAGAAPVIVGGIIPAKDAAALRERGVAAVFGPESPLDELTEAVRAAAATRVRMDVSARRARFQAHDPSALAETLTHIERDPAAALPDGPKRALRVGITGAPGVGKSTLIGRLIDELRRRGRRVAVLLVDPSSPRTGGALLGDRVRLRVGDEDDGVFVRSAASAGSTDALATAALPMLDALDAFGFDVLLLETVGAGQADTAVCDAVQTVVLVLQPGTGDELQLAKAGLTEVADLFVVNKADQPGADRLATAVKHTCADDKPVVQTTASRGEGVGELVDLLLAAHVGRTER